MDVTVSGCGKEGEGKLRVEAKTMASGRALLAMPSRPVCARCGPSMRESRAAAAE